MTTIPATTLDVRPVSGALGAEVHGVDLNNLTDEVFAELHKLLLDYLVIFIVGQSDLTPEAHVAFGRRFGELETPTFLPTLEQRPEITVLESERGVKVDVWHTDLTFLERPTLGSILHLVQCPPSGGDTMWSNQYLVYEQLSAPMRDLLDGLTAVHYVHLDDYTSQAEHPVVRIHPETQRRCLFVNRQFTSHIPQLTRHESDALLQYLFEYSESPPFQCRYHWQPGDVAVWDNRATQHYAVNDYLSPRRGHRVTILGDRPTGQPPRWPHHEDPPGSRYWPRQVTAAHDYVGLSVR